MKLIHFVPLLIARLCVLALLIVAGIVTPVVYTVSIWVLLAIFIFAEFGEFNPGARVAFYYLIIVLMPFYYEPVFGTWVSPLLVLPVLVLFDRALKIRASRANFNLDVKPGKRTDKYLLYLVAPLPALAIVAVLMGAWVLALSCGVVALYILVIYLYSWRKLKTSAINAEKTVYRVIAGSKTRGYIMLVNHTRMPMKVKLVPAYEWFKLRADTFMFDTTKKQVDVDFEPLLSGPEAVTVHVHLRDSRGIVTALIKLEVMQLFVISRSRYARWLAEKYLRISRGGSLSTQESESTQSKYPSRVGLDFYGFREYLPGDNIRNLDFKRSLKFGYLLSQEYLDTSTEKAALMVNLAVADDEEKDLLVANLITTALTLAKDGIPFSIGAYDMRDIVEAGRLQGPKKGLINALAIADKVEIQQFPQRYLEPSDIVRLTGNIRRLQNVQSVPAQKMASLLKMEYSVFYESAKHNPATLALKKVMDLATGKPNIIFISGKNHDAETIELINIGLQKRGYQTLVLDLKQGATGMNKLAQTKGRQL